MPKEDNKTPLNRKRQEQGTLASTSSSSSSSSASTLNAMAGDLTSSSLNMLSTARGKAAGIASSARDWIAPNLPNLSIPLSQLESLTTVMFSPLAAHPVYRSESMARALQLMQQQQRQRSSSPSSSPNTSSTNTDLVLHGRQYAWPSSADLLKADIPESNAPLSLFQGFAAAYPSLATNAVGSPKRSRHRRKKPQSGSPSPLMRPSSKSLTQIIAERERKKRECDKIEMQMSSTMNEIGQINLQMDELMNKRKALEAKWAKLEAKERQLQIAIDDLSETLLEAEGGWDDKDNASLRRKQRQEKEDEDEDEELEFGTVMKTLSGHEDAILCLDFNHPKGILVSSSLDGTVRAWDLQLNQCIGMLEGHSSTVRCLQLDNARLFTGSDDGTIRHWDLTAIPPIRSPTSMDSFSNFSSAPSSPTLSTVTAAEDLVPSFNDGGLGVFQGHTGEITALYTDHQTIVSGSNDRTMKQWDIETQQCILTLDVQWASKGGNTSFSSGWDTLAALENWTLDSLRYTNFERSSDYIGALQFWNFALANGTVDGKIRMWDLRTGQAHRTLPGHNAAVTCLQFDEVHLVSGSADKTIRIWDLRTGSVFDTLTYEGPVTSLQFDAGKIISGSNSAQIDIYNRTSFQHTSLVGHSEPVNSIRFRNNVLASGSRDHAIKLWAL